MPWVSSSSGVMGMNTGVVRVSSFTLCGVRRLPSAFTPFTPMKPDSSTSSSGRLVLRLSYATWRAGSGSRLCSANRLSGCSVMKDTASRAGSMRKRFTWYCCFSPSQ